MTDFAAARQHMVDSQIRTNKVFGAALLAALSRTPREIFVSEPMRAVAYVDEDIDCGNRRRLMEPMVFARLVELLAVAPADIVLDIGCGSGYSSAILARLASTVVALEADGELAGRAQTNLARLGIDNVVVVVGPLQSGYPDQAPYNGILLGGAVADLSPALTDQIADGGRLGAVVRPPGGVGRAILATRIGGVVSRRAVFDASTPILPGFEAEEGFVL